MDTEVNQSIVSALVVEDLPEAQLWLGNLLREAYPGISVSTASSLASALEELARKNFDLALIDLSLGDGSGIEAIKAARTLETPPVCIVTTIFNDEEHVFNSLKAGAQGYLLKDSPSDELLLSLKGVIDGKPALSPMVARRVLSHFQPSQEAEVSLAPREKDVLSLIAKGYTVLQVADELSLSRHTVASYIKQIYRKLEISSRAEAATEAARRGIL